MSKRQFKSQASSGRVGSGFGGFGGSAAFGSTGASVLSYIQEPPDYSSVSDSNVVVAFKNLLKKDSTTKAKALEDLQTYLISNDGVVEDAVIEAWVKLFPRLSIDNARRVRQVAHQLNGQLCAKCGKRVARHLPRIAGPWLAGTFDVDRSASKAAQDALNTVFPNAEKVQGLRKTFHESILEYCRDALLNETVQTLSDERSVSSDDAQNTFDRVIASSLAVISSLLETLASDEVSKQSHLYEQIFGDSKTWDFATHSDASVRRAAHRLIQLCVRQNFSLIESNLKSASKAYVSKGLASDQTASANDFARTLLALTEASPSIWTTAYSGKKTAVSRLQQCLRQGSHSGTSHFWDIMREILLKLPDGVLPKAYEDVSDLLLAARDGVSRKEERFNASSAWPMYFALINVTIAKLSEQDTQTLLKEFAIPPINQYLLPADDAKKWTITGSKAASLVAKAASVKGVPPLLEREWPHFAEKVIEAAKMSQPEQSKDFDRSQKHVASIGERWADLQREMYSKEYALPETVHESFAVANTKILEDCIALLKTRNGKPYGAAAVIEQQLRTCAAQLIQHSAYRQTLVSFVIRDVPHFMYSPSQRHLIRFLYVLESDPAFEEAFERTLGGILDATESNDLKTKAIHALFPMNTPAAAVKLAQSNESLQSFLGAATGDGSTDMLADLIKLGASKQSTTDAMLAHLMASLSLSGSQRHSSLSAFEQLTASNPTAIRDFMATPTGEQLLPSVLRLEQSPEDAVAAKASSLSARLSSAMGEAANDAKYSVILHSLENTSSSSLSIDAVLELADKVTGDDSSKSSIKDMLPSADIWRRSISAITKLPKASLSILSPLGGAVHLVRSDMADATGQMAYDEYGMSQALRIGIYLAHMLSKPGALQSSGEAAATMVALLHICVLLAEDNTSILAANALWRPAESNHVEEDVMDFVSRANSVMKLYWESIAQSSSEAVQAGYFDTLRQLRAHYQPDSAFAYYVELAAAKALENIFELHGYSKDQTKTYEERMKSQKSTEDHLSLVSFLIGYAQPLAGSPGLTRLFNELVADLTELIYDSDEARTLQPLSVLNAALRTQADIASTVQKTRLIFFVKHMISWLSEDFSILVKAEACKALSSVLTTMSDTYGELWSQIIEFLLALWTNPEIVSDGTTVSEAGVTLIHASLRLYDTLNRLAKEEEPNDDLVEALSEHKGSIHNGMIALLKSSSSVPDETHQPLMITNQLLARELSRVPFQPLADSEELFPLLYTPSHAVQGAAFSLLHDQIPAAQEQISFDAALDNKTAQLPDELLSLIIEAPTLDTLADASFERAMPLALQGFLYSWRLLFDHFTNSSYRVKSNYVEQLKEGSYLPGLLDLVFDFLGHTRGRPVDASKFDLQEYIGGAEPIPERDVQWLLSHLYYLALSNLPSLVKSYFLDIRSRQTSQAIETWTARYIAPMIINASLQSVADWAEKSVKDDPEYDNMTVKVGMRSREVNVSYLVDEQTMAIKVVLPETYPLDVAKVVSVNRVAVKEEKWNSWLRNCQGVIAFSNGSITDGLSAWRKNVIGALKGQTECAICYSIISGDKQLPTKRCPTCKNLFHAGCLLKWFKTSNASTCPLCRNPFNFN